jgi:DNA-binding NtrC family response regulator
VSEGGFREDLFYRLNVHVLTVPPLKDRLSDIPDLVNHILATTCRRYGMAAKSLSGAAMDLLMSYDWRRNNVRELRNVIERLVIAAPTDVVEAEHVPADLHIGERLPRSDRPMTFQERKTEAERRIVLAALERNDWHITNTAGELGLADHASLLKVMRRHGIKRDS